MIRLCLSIILLCAAGASSVLKAQQEDPEAILSEAEAAFDALSSYACHIRVDIVAESHPNVHPEHGSYFYQQGMYHMDFPEDEVICDGSRKMTWNKAFGMINWGECMPAGDLSLAGLYRLYHHGHELEYLGEEEGRHHIRLQLTETNGFPQRDLWIGKESHLIEHYVLYSPSMGTFHYTLSDVEVNGEIDPELFVIDMEFVKKVENGEIPLVDPHQHEGEDSGHEHGHDHGEHADHDHD